MYRSWLLDSSQEVENGGEDVSLKNHAKGISVEAEVGTIGGEEDGIIDDGELAPIEDAKAMVATGIDFLAATS